MTDLSETGASTPFPRSEEQALATFNYAAKERRSLSSHQWRITEYAAIAYAALAAAPSWVKSDGWLWSVSLLAVVLVWVVALQALRSLWYARDVRDSEHKRLLEALNDLSLIHKIHFANLPTDPSGRPWWVKFTSARGLRDVLGRCAGKLDPPIRKTTNGEQGTDGRPSVEPGLSLAVLVGAIVASVIILSRL